MIEKDDIVKTTTILYYGSTVIPEGSIGKVTGAWPSFTADKDSVYEIDFGELGNMEIHNTKFITLNESKLDEGQDMKEFTIEAEAESILEYVDISGCKSAEEVYTKFIDEAFCDLAPGEAFSSEEELEISFIENHKKEITEELSKLLA